MHDHHQAHPLPPFIPTPHMGRVKVTPRATDVIAREDVLVYLEEIYRAISQNTPEAWAVAADNARKIENACEITKTALILKQNPQPSMFSMESFAAQSLGMGMPA